MYPLLVLIWIRLIHFIHTFLSSLLLWFLCCRIRLKLFKLESLSVDYKLDKSKARLELHWKLSIELTVRTLFIQIWWKTKKYKVKSSANGYWTWKYWRNIRAIWQGIHWNLRSLDFWKREISSTFASIMEVRAKTGNFTSNLKLMNPNPILIQKDALYAP